MICISSGSRSIVSIKLLQSISISSILNLRSQHPKQKRTSLSKRLVLKYVLDHLKDLPIPFRDQNDPPYHKRLRERDLSHCNSRKVARDSCRRYEVHGFQRDQLKLSRTGRYEESASILETRFQAQGPHGEASSTVQRFSILVCVWRPSSSRGRQKLYRQR